MEIMTFYNFMLLLSLIIIIYGLFWYFKKPVPIIFKIPKQFKKSKKITLLIQKVSVETVFEKCINWLSVYNSKITDKKSYEFITAIHKIDLTIVGSRGNPIRLMDIPKKLEFHFNKYAGTDVKISLIVSIDTNTRGIKRFDFIDLNWYKQELITIFNEYSFKEINDTEG